jgi:hypothetical protein
VAAAQMAAAARMVVVGWWCGGACARTGREGRGGGGWKCGEGGRRGRKRLRHSSLCQGETENPEGARGARAVDLLPTRPCPRPCARLGATRPHHAPVASRVGAPASSARRRHRCDRPCGMRRWCGARLCCRCRPPATHARPAPPVRTLSTAATAAAAMTTRTTPTPTPAVARRRRRAAKRAPTRLPHGAPSPARPASAAQLGRTTER